MLTDNFQRVEILPTKSWLERFLTVSPPILTKAFTVVFDPAGIANAPLSPPLETVSAKLTLASLQVLHSFSHDDKAQTR